MSTIAILGGLGGGSTGILSASYAISSSYANNTLTASYVNAAGGGAGVNGVQAFTQSNNVTYSYQWTVPPGISRVRVVAVGAGGGGGGGDGGSPGQDGGRGGYSEGIATVTGYSSVTVFVGKGGLGEGNVVGNFSGSRSGSLSGFLTVTASGGYGGAHISKYYTYMSGSKPNGSIVYVGSPFGVGEGAFLPFVYFYNYPTMSYGTPGIGGSDGGSTGTDGIVFLYW